MKKLFSLFILILSLFKVATNLVEGTKVAIIGQTLSGALCSYYLHQLIPNIQIDFFDDDPNIEKHKILTFHSIHHKHIEEILSLDGIDSKNLYPSGNPMIYHDGFHRNRGPCRPETLLYTEPEDYEILSNIITSTFKKFENVYIIQNEKKMFFTTPNELLVAVNPEFSTYLKITWLEFLKRNSIAKNAFFVYLLDILILRSYLQQKNIHAFAGLSVFWFSELNDGGRLKRFKGTSYDVILTLIKKNNDTIKERIIKEVIQEEDGNLIITIDQNSRKRKNRYDFVIIAKPNDGKIQFSGFTTNSSNCKYWNVYITEIRGSLQDKCLGSYNSRNVPSVIDPFGWSVVTTLDDNYFLWNIASVHPLKYLNFEEYFRSYKFFDVVLGKQVSMLKMVKILAYPDYRKYQCVGEANFYLGKYLYNVNAIDWAASNTEMMAIGAKNVALLIEKTIN